SYSTTDTTTTVESDKTESESDSYFSEGAWLLSKSEGEIWDLISGSEGLNNNSAKIIAINFEII
ncbi:hypothetical protein BpHYR1_032192, partial [Brachionus plicatilis]